MRERLEINEREGLESVNNGVRNQCARGLGINEQEDWESVSKRFGNQCARRLSLSNNIINRNDVFLYFLVDIQSCPPQPCRQFQNKLITPVYLTACKIK